MVPLFPLVASPPHVLPPQMRLTDCGVPGVSLAHLGWLRAGPPGVRQVGQIAIVFHAVNTSAVPEVERLPSPTDASMIEDAVERLGSDCALRRCPTLTRLLTAERERSIEFARPANSLSWLASDRLLHRVDARGTRSGTRIASMWTWSLLCDRAESQRDVADNSYSRFVAAHGDRLLGAIRARFRLGETTSEEIMIETFARFWHRYMSDNDDSCWEPRCSAHLVLVRIARNIVIDRARKKQDALVEDLVGGAEGAVGNVRDTGGTGVDPESLMELVVEISARVLTGRQGEVFELRVLRGQSGIATAAALGVSPPYVARELGKARQKVAAALTDELGELTPWMQDVLESSGPAERSSEREGDSGA